MAQQQLLTKLYINSDGDVRLSAESSDVDFLPDNALKSLVAAKKRLFELYLTNDDHDSFMQQHTE